MDENKLKQIISQLEQSVVDLKSMIDKPNNLPKQAAKPQGEKSLLCASSSPVIELGPVPDYKSPDWPKAVHDKMIIKKDNKPDQKFRALQIVNHVREIFNDKKVLDFGCGSGYVAAEAAHVAALSVGYDIHDIELASEQTDELIFTNDIGQVTNKAPYDIIILYDVLDHVVSASPVDIMNIVKGLIARDGTIFVRTHPWTSRTGGHAYETHNKAYIHMALTADELAAENIKLEPNLKIVRPMAAYESWFATARLETISKKSKHDPVDSFFSDDIINRIIKINWDGKMDPDTARKIMSNQFIDYKLKLE
jgi:2-polyprenyl-3-methyl-5-hydroxy-6-metoxy-1,4-benzoquinol methylase